MLSELDPLTLAIIVTALGIAYRIFLGTKGKDISEIKIRPIIQTVFVTFTASILLVLSTFEAIEPGLPDSAFMPIVLGQLILIIGSDAAVRSAGKKIMKTRQNSV